jgi:HK97 gp10 family phage protein
MATRARFDLKGMSEYLEQIQQAGVDIDAAAKRALEKGASILQAEMDSLVPVDSGNLKGNIVISGPFQDGNRNYVEVGAITDDTETAKYANVQEFGSPSKNIPAQPYIRPAIDRKKSAVMRAIRESLKAEGMVD